MTGMRGLGVKVLGLAAMVVAIALGAIYLGRGLMTERILFETPHQAVLMVNGQLFFGRLHKAGSAYPVLKDVYYFQQQINAETKVGTSLVKRGQELHAPDHMVLNAQHILLIVPVRTDSRMAKLIEDLQKR